MNPIYVTGYLKHREKAEDSDKVVTVENLRFQLYHDSSCDLGSSAFHAVILMFGPVAQAIAAVVQVFLVVRNHRLNDCYGLFQCFDTPATVHIDGMTTLVAPMLGTLVRLGVGYRVPFFR